VSRRDATQLALATLLGLAALTVALAYLFARPDSSPVPAEAGPID
jgi:hypothetical protein